MIDSGVPIETLGTRAWRSLAVYLPFQLGTIALVTTAFWDSSRSQIGLVLWLTAQPAVFCVFLTAAILRPPKTLKLLGASRWAATLNLAAMPWVLGDRLETRAGGLTVVIALMMAATMIAIRGLATADQNPRVKRLVGLIVVSVTSALLVQGNFIAAAISIGTTALLMAEFYFGRLRHVELRQWAEWRDEIAQSDPLTGVLNRRGFLGLLDGAVSTGAGGALVMLDLDRFKVINDAHGHAAGDQVLSTVAERLVAELPDARVGRIGGDEFGILFTPPMTTATAEKIIVTTLRAIEVPIATQQSLVRVRASAGITSIVAHVEAEQLIAEADVSMYESKRKGGRRLTVFSDLRTHPLEQAKLEHRLRGALEVGEITFDIQPIVSCSGSGLVGVELLARWPQADGSTIPPTAFVPIIHRSGLSSALTERALESAAALFDRWRLDPQLSRLGINVNVEPDSLDEELGALISASIKPEFYTQFGIELVESSIVDLSVLSADVMNEIGASGIRIYLDDFGTGESSLSQLQTLPVTNLKIDRSFVRDCDRDPSKREVLRLIGELGQSLSISVLAEGVETPEEWAFLQTLPVRTVQGFLPGEPVSMVDCDDYLRSLWIRPQAAPDAQCPPIDDAQVARRQRRFESLGWIVDVDIAQAQERLWP